MFALRFLFWLIIWSMAVACGERERSRGDLDLVGKGEGEAKNEKRISVADLDGPEGWNEVDVPFEIRRRKGKHVLFCVASSAAEFSFDGVILKFGAGAE